MNKNKEILANDPITKAVDKANEILKPLGLCVGEVAYINPEEIGKRDYEWLCTKNNCRLYTSKTLSKIKSNRLGE